MADELDCAGWAEAFSKRQSAARHKLVVSNFTFVPPVHGPNELPPLGFRQVSRDRLTLRVALKSLGLMGNAFSADPIFKSP